MLDASRHVVIIMAFWKGLVCRRVHCPLEGRNKVVAVLSGIANSNQTPLNTPFNSFLIAMDMASSTAMGPPMSETEQRVLELYDRLRELQLELALLGARPEHELSQIIVC